MVLLVFRVFQSPVCSVTRFGLDICGGTKASTGLKFVDRGGGATLRAFFADLGSALSFLSPRRSEADGISFFRFWGDVFFVVTSSSLPYAAAMPAMADFSAAGPGPPSSLEASLDSLFPMLSCCKIES